MAGCVEPIFSDSKENSKFIGSVNRVNFSITIPKYSCAYIRDLYESEYDTENSILTEILGILVSKIIKIYEKIIHSTKSGNFQDEQETIKLTMLDHRL